MARNKQIGPEIKLYQIDTMIYLTTKNIVSKIEMFSKFLEWGGIDQANSARINNARAVERFDKNYRISDIKDLNTIDGQANETWLRKSGFLVSTDGKYELSSVATAIIENRISIAEYCFLILSKQWVIIKKPGEPSEYKANLLALVLEILSNHGDVPAADFVTTINQDIVDKYIDEYDGLALSNQEASRFIIEPLLLSGILVAEDNVYRLSVKHIELIENYLLNYNKIKNPNELPCLEESYLNCFEYGVFDIIDADNEPVYANLYPGLFKQTASKDNAVDDSMARQQIFYGAPGTGKSHTIDKEISEDNSIRTTFHPDSDYASFVGCYKPSMERNIEQLYNKEELISKLTELKKQGVTYAPQKFGAQYWYSLKRLTTQNKKDILTACEMSDTYTVEFDKGIAVGEELRNKSKEAKIVYKFIPQAFLKAYIKSWSVYDPKKDNPFYLVIEEINRGNCAQIFGDLFQLLDRNNMGASSYSINADDDIRHFIDEEDGGFKGLSEEQKKIISEFVLVKDTGKEENIGEAILNGTKLLLPPNMRIWATMNTSDQSLFPIDSAFKRRWDWKYIPIEYDKENWVFEVGGKHYNWGEFLSKINPEIYTITESPDKQMGYYFAKANLTTGIISQDTFVNKVLFYLWADVFKDYDVASVVFKNKKTNRAFRFTDFFEDTEALGNFIENMGLVSP